MSEPSQPSQPSERPEHVNVLIVGAGLSGIGAACHLRRLCPGKSFAVLEARAASGGTWDLFRYPGARSDSDMFTLGYSFRPWREDTAIADAGSILAYLRQTAAEYRIEQQIRYHHRVVHASYSSAETRWSVTVERSDDDANDADAEHVTSDQITCDFLFCNTGYYRYDSGFSPTFEGVQQFSGQLIHPQHWPPELDWTGARVVVIGSGATAVTLVPALAERAAHVTMLQRSPSYVISVPARDPLADLARRRLPASLAAWLLRWKGMLLTLATYQLSRRAPKLMAKLLLDGVRRRLPEGFDVATHFSPRYRPWDQRLCVVPNGNLFAAIRHGQASIVTDTIDSFTTTGLRLGSGAELEADIVVTATGLNLLVLGGMSLDVDGRAVQLSEVVGYKGVMFSGVPNLAVTIGYTNASWTLKADLVARYVCRLLNHLDLHGLRQVTPKAPDPAQPTAPFLNLTSGYVLRSLAQLPRQGSTGPWRLHQNYPQDLLTLAYRPIEDDALEFSR